MSNDKVGATFHGGEEPRNPQTFGEAQEEIAKEYPPRTAEEQAETDVFLAQHAEAFEDDRYPGEPDIMLDELSGTKNGQPVLNGKPYRPYVGPVRAGDQKLRASRGGIDHESLHDPAVAPVPSGHTRGKAVDLGDENWHFSAFEKDQKQVHVAYILLIFFGIIGGHKFYLRRPGLGLAYIFTLGFVGIGVIVDVFTLNEQVNKTNRKINRARLAEAARS